MVQAAKSASVAQWQSNGFVSRSAPEPPAEEEKPEEWRAIAGVGTYEVSNLGRVRRGARVLRDRPHPRGYRIVDVREGDRLVSKTVHRLVAVAFVANAGGRPQVNHRNGNKADNRDSNLEWATALENTAHAIRTGLRRGCDERTEPVCTCASAPDGGAQ